MEKVLWGTAQRRRECETLYDISPTALKIRVLKKERDMSEMEDVFKNLYVSIVGKNCCYIRLGFGSQLRVGIGDKVYYKSSKLEGKYHGEWDLVSRTFAWRIIQDNKILCGSDDEPEFINDILRDFKLGVISHIEKRSIADIAISFSNGVNIDFFCCSNDDNQMILMKKDETAYEFTIDGIYEVTTNEHFNTLSEIESILSEYSKECSKRWKERVPGNNLVEKCDNCFYLRGIDGHFYFWDFGICSNVESPNDGKLVGSASGCEFYRQLKDIVSS